MSAPAAIAACASSMRVMPQILTRTVILLPRRRAPERVHQLTEFRTRRSAAEQALADQKRARARRVEPPNIAGRIDSTFANGHRAARVARQQALGHSDIGHKSMQVAVVDADQLRADFLG